MHLTCIRAGRNWCIGDKSMKSLHVNLDSYDQIWITASNTEIGRWGEFYGSCQRARHVKCITSRKNKKILYWIRIIFTSGSCILKSQIRVFYWVVFLLSSWYGYGPSWMLWFSPKRNSSSTNIVACLPFTEYFLESADAWGGPSPLWPLTGSIKKGNVRSSVHLPRQRLPIRDIFGAHAIRVL